MDSAKKTHPTIAMCSVTRLEGIQFPFPKLRPSEHAREKSVSETRVTPASSTIEDSWSVDGTRNSCCRELGGTTLQIFFKRSAACHIPPTPYFTFNGLSKQVSFPEMIRSSEFKDVRTALERKNKTKTKQNKQTNNATTPTTKNINSSVPHFPSRILTSVQIRIKKL